MSKLVQIPLLLVLGCIVAGLYGALHNQVSYTVSSEYFTRLKFEQFGISDGIPDRLGAAIVGFLAAWWMGIPIGIVLLPIGLFIRGREPYLRAQLRAYAAVVLTAMTFSVVGLGLSFVAISESNVRERRVIGNEIDNDLQFARAATMHNFSYLGGMLGTMIGCFVIAHARIKQLDAAASKDLKD